MIEKKKVVPRQYVILCNGPAGLRSKIGMYENAEEAKRGAMRLLRDNDIVVSVTDGEKEVIYREKYSRGCDRFGNKIQFWGDWQQIEKECLNVSIT